MGYNLSGPDKFVKTLGKEWVMMGGMYAAGELRALSGQVDFPAPAIQKVLGPCC